MSTAEYWTVSHGEALRNGYSCRNCRGYIAKGQKMVIRTGRKIRLFYHDSCYTGTSDPRTQAGSSFQEARLPQGGFQRSAPGMKGHGKWAVEDYHYRPNAYSRKVSFDHLLEKKEQKERPKVHHAPTWDKVALPPLSTTTSQRSLLTEKRSQIVLPQIKP